MDPSWIVLIAGLAGAVLGALVSTFGAISVQRAGQRRSSRARQIRDLLPPARGRAEVLIHEVAAGRGPVTTTHLQDALEVIEREALAAGRRDGERAHRLVAVAHELWRLEREAWEESAIGHEPKMDVDAALSEQMRALVRVIGRLDKYELWLRGHLEKPWWRRRASMATLPRLCALAWVPNAAHKDFCRGHACPALMLRTRPRLQVSLSPYEIMPFEASN